MGQKDPLEKEMETHSVFLSGESHGQRSLVGYGPWGSQKSWTRLSAHTLSIYCLEGLISG